MLSIRNDNNRASFIRPILAASAVLLLLVTSLLIIIPEEANAETRPGGTLINDASARTLSSGWWWADTPDDLQFKVPTKTNRYTAIAALNRRTGEDFDLFAFNDYSMTTQIASSTKGSDEIDFVGIHQATLLRHHVAHGIVVPGVIVVGDGQTSFGKVSIASGRTTNS